MPLLESYISDGIYYKLENSTICPRTSTMHMLQNDAVVSMYCIVLYCMVL